MGLSWGGAGPERHGVLLRWNLAGRGKPLGKGVHPQTCSGVTSLEVASVL